ncbi:MAG: response regulator [Chloroflexi bacterium]|nr:response regulator [Chloroflexota bacterium]
MTNTIVGLRRTRVVVVEDSAPLRAALRAYLRRYSDDTVTVAGEAWGGWTAIREAATKRADVIVLDMPMPDQMGWEFVHRLHLMVPKACILLATGEPPVEPTKSLREHGICMALERSHLLSTLLQAIWQCRDTGSPLSRESTSHE